MEFLTYSEVASTQETARILAAEGRALPFAVVAETQSRGRGRRGKNWDSPRGGLWLTLALAVPSAGAVHQSAIVAAHAVATVVLTATGLHTLVKWPNDLLVERRKVCGILAETLVQTDTTLLMVGIGLNVNNVVPPDQLPQATSLKAELEHDLDVWQLATSVVTMVQLDIGTLITAGFDPFTPWIETSLALREELVTVEFNHQRTSGRVAGVSRTGALLLKNPNGSLEEVDAGSVYNW
ncbi:MAG TPA: biotin--[acetyl-CoA-carboxylase] ligase [Clostridia bacterium]|nr:biotin--[acetyl-CoA-carboxylase] ligase [Clostridia bacterium]